MIEPVHFSRLKYMARSPLHFRHSRPFETPATRWGSAVHVLALGGDVIVYEGERKGGAWSAFKALVDGAPHHVYDGVRRGKEWERAKELAEGRAIVTTADLEAAERGRVIQSVRRASGMYDAPIVTSSEYDSAARCADAVRTDEIARDILANADTEIPLSWESHGMRCRGRVDILGPSWIADLKTTRDATPAWFRGYALRMAYHAQLDWYAEGARSNGMTVDDHWIIAVESKPPHPVVCMRLTDRALEQGRGLWCLWMEQLRVCIEADHWPGYVQCAVDLDAYEDTELIFDDEAADEAA